MGLVGQDSLSGVDCRGCVIASGAVSAHAACRGEVDYVEKRHVDQADRYL